ncbi:hypothetical protein E4T48_06242 [Aureobasidium sp. EXF-10727]|nr:hypothetical protein E4T48_06242 [Aureobasidium sp. EXF-10727]
MLCQPHTLRLRDSRHSLHHIFRHAVTYPQQRLRYQSHVPGDTASDHEAARLKALKAARLKALERLDQHITPDDLSATLEAHRASNRTSIIRRVRTGTDPDVERPSFLDSQIPIRRIRPAQTHRTPLKENADKSARATFNRIIKESSDRVDPVAVFQLKSLNRATEIAEREKADELRRENNAVQYSAWRDFLAKHEHPAEPVPEYNFEDRATFFGVLRRVYAVLRAEQARQSTTQAVYALADTNFLEYESFPRPIIAGLQGYHRPLAWSRRPPHSNHTYKQWLDTEVLAFAEWMDMTPSENAAREKLSDILIDLVKQADPGLQAEKFGSQSTGLTMPNSDIDIRVVDPTLDTSPVPSDLDRDAKAAFAAERSATRKRTMISHLRTVQSKISQHEDFADAELNEAAFFPLITAVHKPTGLKIQVVSTRDVHASQEATKKYLAEFPQLKPTFLVLKTALNLRNLSDPWTGGVGSYTLFMMCVAALKHQAQSKEPTLSKPGASFIHVLDFWSRFDTKFFALSVEPFLIFQKKSMFSRAEREARITDPSLWARHRIATPLAYKPFMLHLQDPANAYNDLGRSATAIKDVQATFKKLFDDLTWDLQDPKRKEDEANLLKDVVGNSERYFDEMRVPVDLWGEQWVEEMQGRQQGELQGLGEEGVEEGASVDVSEEAPVTQT